MAPNEKRDDTEALIADIFQSKKYRDIGICEDTIRDLIATELGRHKKRGEGVKAVRKKLHQVIALYLGDPDYAKAINELEIAIQSANPERLKESCRRIMSVHATTRERLPILADFYRQIFEVTGKPGALLDIACGLNPLSFPWMQLPTSTRYYAYDIHQKRVNFLNQFFSLLGLLPLAKFQDVLTHFPEERADVAFIFKEVHRFERRRQGCTLPLLDALRVRHLVISFPTKSLSGRRDLAGHYHQLFYDLIKDRSWPVTEIEFEDEFIFCVDKKTHR